MAYFDQKQELIKVFEDTEKTYSTHPVLKESIQNSIKNTEIWKEGKKISLEKTIRYEITRISVNKFKSLETAYFYNRKFPEAKIAIHNFASATNPGGGVRKGSKAQEEALCRCMTLLPVLDTPENRKEFYDFHRNRHNVLYSDAVIYTPDIVAFKSDTDKPGKLLEKAWKKFDVLTCAAPNLRKNPNNYMNPGKDKPIKISDSELKKLHVKRARHLLSVAAFHEVDILILGAFGCGAFQNPPNIVAEAYKDVLDEFYGCFQEVAFSVYCTPRDSSNYKMFSKILG